MIGETLVQLAARLVRQTIVQYITNQGLLEGKSRGQGIGIADQSRNSQGDQVITQRYRVDFSWQQGLDFADAEFSSDYRRSVGNFALSFGKLLQATEHQFLQEIGGFGELLSARWR